MLNKIVAALAVGIAMSACPRPPSNTLDQAALPAIGEQPSDPHIAPPQIAELSGLGMGGLIGYQIGHVYNLAATHFAAR